MTELMKTALTPLYENDVIEWEEVMGYNMPSAVVGTDAEYTALRTAVIAQDYSMLFKWFVEGPGARSTINALVTRDITDLPVGQIAYSAVVDHNGGMIDDVTVSVLADDAFLVIGGNPEVLEALQAIAPAGTTVEERREKHAVLSVQGPKSRELLQRLTDADLSNSTLPFYGLVADIQLAGVTASVFRVGFTAELGYEVMVAAGDAEALYTAVFAQKDLGVTPFAGGALMIARIEAGFMLAEVDYDPSVTPFECRLGWTVDLRKSVFRGKQALTDRKADAPNRVVSVTSEASPEELEGSHLFLNGHDVGEVTMAVPSPALHGATLGLARVAKAADADGTTFTTSISGAEIVVTIVSTPVHDPERLRPRS